MFDPESEERRDRTLFGLPFRATDAQHREILAEYGRLPTFRRWSTLDYRVKEGTFRTLDPEATKLCEELVSLDAQMQAEARKLVERKLAEWAAATAD